LSKAGVRLTLFFKNTLTAQQQQKMAKGGQMLEGGRRFLAPLLRGEGQKEHDSGVISKISIFHIPTVGIIFDIDLKCGF
jgi:hypothetical protein